MAKKLDFDKLNSTLQYALWSAFQIPAGTLGDDRAAIAAEFQQFLDSYADSGVTVRGVYDVSALRPEADIMFWVHGEDLAELQAFYRAFRRTTQLGKVAVPVRSNAALHRPAEFNRSHVPDFLVDPEPKRWICLYPFVRTPEWYLMDEQERRRMLVQHGMEAREFNMVRANTIPAFGLGDYEWMLAFESPQMEDVVNLMWKMRYTDARNYVSEETPFYSGQWIMDQLPEYIESLP
ncbi:chlorite dismutase family protein [Corynebacterium sp. 320]|uniref:hydrogen peroxide-dependent heme synthase n=1 Tax=Corynebacterium TaxID=1716 RepID=UPI00125CB543|nr:MULTISPECIES: hydrogen peroxide-dependent heme synthase [Corynebacterium]KAB1501444.1 chlorite dismutase family protein [Corynebacterium sp. 320]KAB1551741.1 chlorite dismutase family protein [Corynebacterium sp. 319]KAB3525802.1 chlorite dismutase family protein [Corynebacterium sp. 250]KAB3538736.1 chlorite dismutase family protein [Corynebacterium sp. 366]QNP92688.1 chlorite dismutase family protein [Corynebacterium zhongnanshanii]